MAEQPLEQRLREIISIQLDVDPSEVVPGASFVDDLGAGSLDLVELALMVEDEFAVDVGDECFETVRTVEDAMEHLRALLWGARP